MIYVARTPRQRPKLDVVQRFARAYLDQHSLLDASKAAGLSVDEGRIALVAIGGALEPFHRRLVNLSRKWRKLRLHTMRGFRARASIEPLTEAERGGEWALHLLATPGGCIISWCISREEACPADWLERQRARWPEARLECPEDDSDDDEDDSARTHKQSDHKRTGKGRELHAEDYGDLVMREWLDDEHRGPGSVFGALAIGLTDYQYGPSKKRLPHGVAAGCLPAPATIEQMLAFAYPVGAADEYFARRTREAESVLADPTSAAGEGWRALARAWMSVLRKKHGPVRPRSVKYEEDERKQIVSVFVASQRATPRAKVREAAHALGIGHDTVKRFWAQALREGWVTPEEIALVEAEAFPRAMQGRVTEAPAPQEPPPISIPHPSTQDILLHNGTRVSIDALARIEPSTLAAIAVLDAASGAARVLRALKRGAQEAKMAAQLGLPW